MDTNVVKMIEKRMKKWWWRQMTITVTNGVINNDWWQWRCLDDLDVTVNDAAPWHKVTRKPRGIKNPQTWYLLVELKGISATFLWFLLKAIVSPSDSWTHFKSADSDASPFTLRWRTGKSSWSEFKTKYFFPEIGVRIRVPDSAQFSGVGIPKEKEGVALFWVFKWLIE